MRPVSIFSWLRDLEFGHGNAMLKLIWQLFLAPFSRLHRANGRMIIISFAPRDNKQHNDCASSAPQAIDVCYLTSSKDERSYLHWHAHQTEVDNK
eukprot:scaffold692_cov118-Cylindrotheca_fusiformis.AAC.5